MNKQKKIIIIALGIILLGIIVCLIGFFSMKKNLKLLNTSKYIERSFDVDDDFKSISINTDNEDIFVKQSQDGKCKVVSYSDENQQYDISVKSDTLTIKYKNTVRWSLGINTENPTLTVYLPKTEYTDFIVDTDTGKLEADKEFTFEKLQVDSDTGAVSLSNVVKGDASIETDTGKINLSDMSADNITLKTNTGHISLNDIKCSKELNAKTDTGHIEINKLTSKDMTLESDTGKVSLESAINEESLQIKTDTGNVTFNESDAESVYIKTNTGSVSGSFLTDKKYVTKSDTGNINVPNSSEGGQCEITTDTGNINIK